MEAIKDIKFKQEAFLFKEEERCPVSELTGERILLNNPIIDVALDRIMDSYEPQNRFAIFSLCTITRPYLKSVKWKAFYRNFGHCCDLIICSNGGIIPMEYMNCWPFLEYDAHGDSSTDELYKELFERRLTKFLAKFGNCWEKKIFTFNPSTRNREVITKLGLEYNLPSLEVYQDTIKNGSPGVNVGRSPQASHQCLDEMAKVLGVERLGVRKRRKLF